MKSSQAEIIREYLVKYSSLGSCRIAKTICQDIPGLFKDDEAARRMIRYYRGTSGKHDLANIAPENYIPKIEIAVPDSKPYDKHILTSGYPVIIGGDAHVPYHDQDAIEIFIERAVEIKAKTVMLAGDWIDFYMLSRFVKDPRKRSVKGEIQSLYDILCTIRNALPDAKIIYKYGNHEERLDNYLMINAPALYGLKEVELENLLNLDGLGIDVVKDKRIIKLGHLAIIHGHEYIYSISNPVNPARGLFNRAKKSAICFHHHQTSEHTEPTISGDIITTWSGGCLCGLNPEYMPLNKWNLGFVEIYDDDGFYRVNNRRIVNYKLL